MFTPFPGLFLMNKEQKVDIMENFEEKSEGIMPFMNFSITLGVCIHLYFLLESVLKKTTNLKITPGIVRRDFAYHFYAE